MPYLESILLFDVAAIGLMLLIAYLSRRLGDALKIPPYFRLLYLAVLCIIVASFIDIYKDTQNTSVLYLANILRVSSGIGALAVCFRYWNWLIPEYIKK